MGFNINISERVKKAISQVQSELPSRAFRASNVLRNAELEVMRGQRGGRTYRKPSGGNYTASAPGEPPAWRTGTLARSWRPIPNGNNPTIESSVEYAGYMENGTPGGMIAPRPFAQRTVDKAEPEIVEIYSEPYNINL